MSDDRLYLVHILESIERIEDYTHEGKAAFVASRLIQDAVARNFEIIGEATKRIAQTHQNCTKDHRGSRPTVGADQCIRPGGRQPLIQFDMVALFLRRVLIAS